MNKLLRQGLLGMAVFSLVFIYSCSDDEDTTPTAAAPTISVSTNGSAFDAGDTLEITIDFTAAGELSSINWVFTIDDVTGDTTFNSPTALSLTDPATEGSVPVSVVLTEADFAGTSVTVYFEVVDKANQKSSDEVSFTVAEAEEDATVLSAVILAAPTGDNNSDTFYSIRAAQLYSQSDVLGTSDPVSETIDIAYYYGASDEATLVSPDDYPSNIVDLSAWGTRNTTNLELTVLTDEEYMALSSVDDVEEAIDGITFDSDNTITNLAVGDILAFATTDASEIEGFIRVVAINGTFNAGDGIEIEIITNQAAE